MLEELTGASLVRRCLLAILAQKLVSSLLLKQRIDLADKPSWRFWKHFLNEPIQFVAFTPAYLIQFRSLHSYRFDGLGVDDPLLNHD